MPTSTLPDVDDRIRQLFINNLAAQIGRGGVESVESYEIPAALRCHGYTGVAKIMGVADHTIRHYWQDDLRAGRSQAMPPPDAIIGRFIARKDGHEDFEVLPGWLEDTIREWMPVRIGTGNHTRGENRRGNDKGRKGWTKATALDRIAERAEAKAQEAADRAETAARMATERTAAAKRAAKDAKAARAAAEAKASA